MDVAAWAFWITAFEDYHAISMVGFAATLWNVRRARTAAQAAAVAAREVRETVARFNALTEVSEALAMLEECKRLIRMDGWVLLPDRLSALRRLLVGVRHSGLTFTDSQARGFQDTIRALSKLENKVADQGQLGESGPNRTAMHTQLNKLADELHVILIELRNGAGG